MSKKCIHCGNNPTPHRLAWLSQSFVIVMNPVGKFISSSFLSRALSHFSHWFFQATFAILDLFGAIEENTDKNKVVSWRGKALWDEAERRGIPMKSFIVWKKPVDIYEVIIKGKKIRFNGLPRPPHNESGADWWLDDKATLKKKLQQARIPVADGGSFSHYTPLRKKFDTLRKPVIIKPRIGSRGRHTTTRISTEEELKKAFDQAKKLCYWVVMEEHLVGSVYRGTMIDGSFTGNLRGDPPRVTGDGIHTIEELVVEKNKNRNPQVSEVRLHDGHKEFLKRTGKKIDDIIPAGETIDLLEKVGISYGGYSAEVTDITHPEIKPILEQAAAIVKDPMIGFDFIIEDITRSPHEQIWGIIECNGVPFINLHHYPIEGKPNHVARYVWEYVEKNIELF
ncbi:MAG TPA: hypothetical protein PK295_00805 [Candidatus Magasanikbacteria bacterium]|nr:hypothetical protein [Candidatus Magasanikbacteria bacterium]